MIFKWFHALSLDVVLGALATGLFVVKVLEVSVPWSWWVVLATAVWSVYTADHLLDGKAMGTSSLMFRHRLHFKKRQLFLILLVFAAASALLLSFLYFDRKVLGGGIILGLVTAAYLWLVSVSRNKGAYFQKELFVSVVYVTGIWFAPVIWKGGALSLPVVMIWVIFVLMGWVDGLMIAALDWQRDGQEHQQSFATYYGIKVTDRLVVLLLILAAVLVLLMGVVGKADMISPARVILGFMVMVFALLFLFRKKLRTKNSYRYLLEMVFWLPATVAFL